MSEPIEFNTLVKATKTEFRRSVERHFKELFFTGETTISRMKLASGKPKADNPIREIEYRCAVMTLADEIFKRQ